MANRPKSNTCIAAVKNKRGKIYIAADRRSSWDFSQAQVMPRSKVRKRDGLILAGTGDGYLCTLMVDCLSIPDYNINDIDVYLHEKLHNQVNRYLISKGFHTNHAKGEIPALKIPSESSAEIVIAVQGKLFQLVIENPEPYSEQETNGLISIDELSLPYATGCGGHLAWGSLLTTENMSLSAKERLTIALNVAAQVSPGCDNNIDIVSED